MHKIRRPGVGRLRCAPWALSVAAVLHGALRPAQATTYTWYGTGADDNWSTNLNWRPPVPPPSDGTPVIVMDGSTRVSPVIDAPWNIRSLTFGSRASDFTLTGSPLTIGSGGITNLSGGPQTLRNDVVLGADQVWDSGTGRYTYLVQYGQVNTNGHTLRLIGSASAALFGVVSGAGKVVFDGSRVALRGNNTYTGGTLVEHGTLSISIDQNLGAPSARLTLNGGALQVDENTDIVRNVTLGPNGGDVYGNTNLFGFSGNIDGPGALNLYTGQYINITGHNSYTGGTFLHANTVIGTTDSLQGAFALAGGADLIVRQSANGTFTASVTGSGGLEFKGGGTIAFTGSNNAEETRIYDAVLEIAGPNALPASRRLFFMGGNGVLQFVGPTSFTWPEPDLRWRGGGGFSAREGKLTVNIGGKGDVFSLDPDKKGQGAALAFGSPTASAVTEFVNPLYLGAHPQDLFPKINVTAGTGNDYALLSGSISGSSDLTKTGNGTLRLTGTNTFSGRLVLAEGAVQGTEGVSIPPDCQVTFMGGVLLSDGPATFNRPLGRLPGQVMWWQYRSGGFAAAGGRFIVDLGGQGAALTWYKDGFVPLEGALVFGAARADSEVVFVNPIQLLTGVREIRVNRGLGGDFATLEGALSGHAGLKKTGPGHLRLTGESTYDGQTLVAEGLLTVDGSIAGSDVIVQGGAGLGGRGLIATRVSVAGGRTPATTGTLTLVDGGVASLMLAGASSEDIALTLGGGLEEPSALNVEVGAGSDRVLITRGKLVVNPGGAIIRVTPLRDVRPGVYDLLEFPTGQASGLEYLTLAAAPLPEGLRMELRSSATSVQLAVVPEPSTGIGAVLAGLALLRRRAGHRAGNNRSGR